MYALLSSRKIIYEEDKLVGWDLERGGQRQGAETNRSLRPHKTLNFRTENEHRFGRGLLRHRIRMPPKRLVLGAKKNDCAGAADVEGGGAVREGFSNDVRDALVRYRRLLGEVVDGTPGCDG